MRKSLMMFAVVAVVASTVNLYGGTQRTASPAAPAPKWYVSVVVANGCRVVRVFGRTRNPETAYNNCMGAALGAQARRDGLTCRVVELERPSR